MSIKLSVKNMPSGGSGQWGVVTQPNLDSGLLLPSQTWTSFRPIVEGETLNIFAAGLPPDYIPVVEYDGLGPVVDGATYVFDFTTRTLSGTKGSNPLIWIAAGAGVLIAGIALASASHKK